MLHTINAFFNYEHSYVSQSAGRGRPPIGAAPGQCCRGQDEVLSLRFPQKYYVFFNRIDTFSSANLKRIATKMDCAKNRKKEIERK
jgi:hypothetical protein